MPGVGAVPKTNQVSTVFRFGALPTLLACDGLGTLGCGRGFQDSSALLLLLAHHMSTRHIFPVTVCRVSTRSCIKLYVHSTWTHHLLGDMG